MLNLDDIERGVHLQDSKSHRTAPPSSYNQPPPPQNPQPDQRTRIAPPTNIEPTNIEPNVDINLLQTRQQASKNARLLRVTLDTGLSKIGSFITGEDSSKYKMTKREAAEYEETATDFFEVSKHNVSPSFAFLVSTLTVFGAIIFRVYTDFKLKKYNDQQQRLREEAQEKKRKQMRGFKTHPHEQPRQEKQEQERYKEKAKVKQEARNSKLSTDEIKEIKEINSYRGCFQLYSMKDKRSTSKTWEDKLIGLYKFTNGTPKYPINHSDALNIGERPSQYIKELIKKHKDLSQKDRNTTIRNHLKELRRIAGMPKQRPINYP